MKNETLGAHLRNLLTPYKNLLQLVKDGKADEETIRKYDLDNLDDLIAFCDSEEMQQKHLEPASEDLEDASNNYCLNIRGYPRVKDKIDIFICNAFKAGAQWQKTQDQQTIELAEEHAMLAGMMQERERMIKDAIEVPVTATGMRANSKGVTTYADIEIPTKERLTPRRDKVKVIIIKE